MNIVIIEDERVPADHLEKNLADLLEDAHIVQLRSVKEAIAYFKSNIPPDLIFSDIQLGDGLSFEIFAETAIKTPVIFCTAYDNYALDAFKANGIDYILKPFTRQMLEEALEKFQQLKQLFKVIEPPSYQGLMESLAKKKLVKITSLLVYQQEKIMPVKLAEIALFHLDNNIVHLLTFSGKVYYPNKNLEELEALMGDSFFRANRQFLLCRKVIVDISSFFLRKLQVNLSVNYQEKVFVSKAKATSFLDWLSKAE